MTVDHFNIVLGSSEDPLTLRYHIIDNPLGELWLNRMFAKDLIRQGMNGLAPYQLDQADRFYNFNNQSDEKIKAERFLLSCIKTINDYQPVIDKPFTYIEDRDYLNYLHNIFKRFHGLVDKQNTEFWYSAPDSVKNALAQLNNAVHRCETANSFHQCPRFVCTWHRLPKTKSLTAKQMVDYGTLNPNWGSICFNYVEIGKTIEDLATDKDNYIGNDAFKPFMHYSADFVARFFVDTDEIIQDRINTIKKYFNEHKEYFLSCGIKNFNDSRILPLRYPVANLIEEMPRPELLKEIQKRQHIHCLKFEW
jgi:hypothetical protein